MKAINASAVPGNSENSFYLENCRHLNGFRASEVKRLSRRRQRHVLRAELPSVVARGLDEGCLFVPRFEPPKVTQSLLPAFPARPLFSRTVKVTRKRARQRSVVEQVEIPLVNMVY